MLRAIRHSGLAPLLSLATLVCVVSLSASTLFHSEADDAICNPVSVVHDHTSHRLVVGSGGEPGSRPAGPEHCAVCHWLSLRTVQTEALADVHEADELRLFTATVLQFSSATVSRQPARAPPPA
ncbi:MAG: hypothetical protein GEU82_12405 [Luteitalea sp.]|nr:hypothetical protein [Luteitalea sp.]